MQQSYALSARAPFPPTIQLPFLTDALKSSVEAFYRQCESEHGLFENYDRDFPDALRQASCSFFETATDASVGPEAMERYFEQFAPLWRATDKRNRNLWSTVLKMITSWERSRKASLYKGPLFYHWGESHIRYGDSDKGFVLLHRAQEEDRQRYKTAVPESAAHWFLSLDEGHASDLRQVTVDMVSFVRRRLDRYRNERGGTLSYAELRAKFLDANDPALADLQLFFAYTVHKLIRFRLIYKLRDIADDQMAPLIYTMALSNLLLVVDRIFKLGLYDHKTHLNVSFLHHLTALKGLTWKQGERYRNAINNSRLYDENFHEVLAALLDSTYRDNEGNEPELLERDVIVAYRLRNYSAHSVKSQAYLWERFPDVTQAVFNAFLLGIERL